MMCLTDNASGMNRFDKFINVRKILQTDSKRSTKGKQIPSDIVETPNDTFESARQANFSIPMTFAKTSNRTSTKRRNSKNASKSSDRVKARKVDSYP